MNAPLVVGVDAGATTTRCVVATVDGAIVARGQAGGANQRSSGGSPSEALAAALHLAGTGGKAPQIALGVVGAAGAGAAGRATAQEAAERAWQEVGLAGRVELATDLEVAFAAGTPSGDGLLLLAGTGAAAVAFHGGLVRHRCDGYGWLLGDEGSAVWLGREALLAVLAAIDGRGSPTTLTAAVTGNLLGTAPAPTVLDDPDAHAQALIGAAYAQPPASLGHLAPLVSAAALAGDGVAKALVARAAGRLLHSLTAVNERRVTLLSENEVKGHPPNIVLAGSVLLSPGPVADLVRAGVRERFGAEPLEARDGAAGAAALAIARLTGRQIPAKIHARLTDTGPATITS